jgi:Spy/CpxP family protein refolding chaperone
MKTQRGITLAWVAGLSLAACASRRAATEVAVPTGPQAEDPATAELNDHHRHHHHGGVTMFITMGLDTLGIEDARRPQVERLQSDLHAAMAPAREAERSLFMTLAQGMSLGRIDEPRVNAAIVRLTNAVIAVHGANAETLNRLHAILSPAERVALADKVQAHWEVWKQVNQEVDADGRGEGGRLSELAVELSLSPDEVDRISTALQVSMAGLDNKFDAKEAQAQVEAFSAAFTADAFDATSITGMTNGHIATHGAVRMAIFYETVAPLLTVEERTKLSEDLQERADHQPPAISVN